MDSVAGNRLAAGILLAGAALAVIGNALHPIILPEVGAEGFLERIGDTFYWDGLHLVLVVAIALLAAGVALLARCLATTSGGPLAVVAAVLAVLSGSIAVVQVGALDGFVLPVLAEQLADGEDVLAVASVFVAFDFVLVGLWGGLLGASFMSLGLAFHRAGLYAAWVRWTAVVAGAMGVLVGALMFLQVAETLTFYAFRVVALALTVVAIAVGLALYREAPVQRGLRAPQAERRSDAG